MTGTEENAIWAAVVASNRAWVQGRPAGVASLFHADAVAVAPGQDRRLPDPGHSTPEPQGATPSRRGTQPPPA